MARGDNGDGKDETAPKTPTPPTETKTDETTGMGIPVVAIFAGAALLVAAVAAVLFILRRRMN